MKTIFRSQNIYTEHGVIDGFIEVEDGRICAISTKCNEADSIIDFKDRCILPGIVDIHNHGYLGWSAKTIDCAEIKGLSNILPSIGVTSALATTSAWKQEEFRMLEAIAQAMKEGCTGTKILGIHMEGPYFNPNKHNATALSEVQLPDVEKIKKYIKASDGNLKYMTLAPEMDNALTVMDYLKEQGIHIGCGHTEADYHTFEIAKLHGMETSIHTGNAMRQMDRREVGLMGGALLDKDIYCEIICDGFHLVKEMLELMFRIKRDYSKFIMISDSDILSGVAPGTYYAFGKNIHVQEDGKILLDDGTINGSSKNILYGMKNLVKNLHIPLTEVIKMCSLNPATLLQAQEDIGSIAEGKYADFIVLNHDFSIYETYINGVSKYKAGNKLNENPKFPQICKRINE